MFFKSIELNGFLEYDYFNSFLSRQIKDGKTISCYLNVYTDVIEDRFLHCTEKSHKEKWAYLADKLAVAININYDFILSENKKAIEQKDGSEKCHLKPLEFLNKMQNALKYAETCKYKCKIGIRHATTSDARDFAYVLCGSWKVAYKDIITTEEMKKNTDVEKRAAFFEKIIPSGKGQFFIAYDGDKPCGICSTCLSRDKDMSEYGEVVAIYILPDYWGTGVGQHLMDTALNGLKVQGYEKIMLWTFEENSRARRFYEKFGFTLDDTYKDSGFTNAKEIRYRLEAK